MKDLWYQTEGTCSRFIHVELSDDDVIQDVQFMGSKVFDVEIKQHLALTNCQKHWSKPLNQRVK